MPDWIRAWTRDRSHQYNDVMLRKTRALLSLCCAMRKIPAFKKERMIKQIDPHMWAGSEEEYIDAIAAMIEVAENE